MHDEAWGDPREHRGGFTDAHADARRSRKPLEVRMPGGTVRGRPGSAGGRESGAVTCGPRSLDLLAGGSRNGYQIIQDRRAHQGVWRPSADSVCTALQQLEDEAWSLETGEDQRRIRALTKGSAVRRARRRAEGVWARGRQRQRRRVQPRHRDSPGHRP
jgi:hypothetical protein